MHDNVYSTQMHNNNEEAAQIKRVQQWIERLEGKAVELLDGLEVEEMTPKHQADVALKCLDHVQRFTAIEKKLQDAAQANDKQGLLAKFMREARGEQELAQENQGIQMVEEDDGQAGEEQEREKEDEEHLLQWLEKQGKEQDEQAEDDEDLWQWLEEQEREWRENNYSEDEEWQEEESWLNNGWWLDDEGELPWEGC